VTERLDTGPSDTGNGHAFPNKGKHPMATNEPANPKNEAPAELPTAKALMQRIAQKEAEKASEYMRQQTAAEAEKKALIERLSKAVG
jgi:hypothetical protein